MYIDKELFSANTKVCMSHKVCTHQIFLAKSFQGADTGGMQGCIPPPGLKRCWNDT